MYKILKINFVLFLMINIMTGCAASKNKIEFKKPIMQVPKKVKKVQVRKGSLYSQQGASLFADKKDLQIGDIIQVVINETLSSNSKNTRDLKKDTTTGIGGGVFAPSAGVTLFGGGTKLLKAANNNIGIGFNSKSANAFKGSSATKSDEAFSTIVSVIIEQIYQNGNYYIKGSKEMLINGQRQLIVISGVIRPYDITPENTIPSSQLANLKIMYRKAGDDADSLEKPWGTKIIETIMPF